MNDRAHWLSLLTAFVHITTGVSQMFRFGPPFSFLPPSWVTFYSLFPGAEWVWLGLFTATGVIALAGCAKPGALRISCWLASALYLTWGAVGLYNTWLGAPGGNIPGSLTNLQLAGAMWVLAHYVTVGVRGNAINEQVVRLAEKVHEIDEHLLVPPDKGA